MGTTATVNQQPQNDRPVVEIKGVHKWFRQAHVLRGVDLTISRGEIMCIVGPSGAGKSTILRCINHLAHHDRGEILINGEPIGIEVIGGEQYWQREKDTARLRANIGMVFQSFNLFPHMTVLRNLTYAPVRVLRLPRAKARARAMELLRLVRLEDKADQFPSKLSGGQQQRVAIARALAMEPELMLFDEPTSALDPELVGEVLEVIRALASTGKTMIIVTHEMAFVRELADTVVFMDNGMVVESGSPTDVFDHPQHERTQAFLRRVSGSETQSPQDAPDS